MTQLATPHLTLKVEDRQWRVFDGSIAQSPPLKFLEAHAWLQGYRKGYEDGSDDGIQAVCDSPADWLGVER